jgi:hypothetical protein
VPLDFGDLGGIGARLVDGAHHAHEPNGIGCGAEPDGITHAERELLGEAALDGDGGELGRCGCRQNGGGEQQRVEERERDHDGFTTEAQRARRLTEELRVTASETSVPLR